MTNFKFKKIPPHTHTHATIKQKQNKQKANKKENNEGQSKTNDRVFEIIALRI
jgi:hypothetical protein